MRLFKCFGLLIACSNGVLSTVSPANAAVTAPSFKPRVSRALSNSALWTTCGDFNGDGRVDVAVGSNNGGGITTFYTQTDGTLPIIGNTTTTASTPTRLSAGDFNADGRADLLYLEDSPIMKLT